MASEPEWVGSSALIEMSDSPEWSYADKYTCTRTFRGPYATALTSAPMPGAAGTGDQEYYIVASSRVAREPGGVGMLQIVYVPNPAWMLEFGGTTGALLPADECGIAMERLDRPLEKHPRYASLTDALVDAVRLLLQNYDQYKAEYEATVTASSLATEMWEKMKRGNTHYAVWVPVYRWRLYYWSAPACTEGGYIEVPGGPVSPPNIDFLRQADQLDWNGSQWVLERSWIGGPEVDTDIYPSL